MNSNIRAVRIALGASAVLAAGLTMSACGSEKGVEPDPNSVVDKPKAPSSAPTCSYTADQMQRRIDAGWPAGCGTDDDLGYGAVNEGHHPHMY